MAFDELRLGLSRVAPEAWATGSTAWDARDYGSVEVQIAGLSGGDTIAFTRSMDSTNYVTEQVMAPNNGFARTDTATADGFYLIRGGGLLKWSKTGSASTPTVTIRAES